MILSIIRNEYFPVCFVSNKVNFSLFFTNFVKTILIYRADVVQKNKEVKYFSFDLKVRFILVHILAIFRTKLHRSGTEYAVMVSTLTKRTSSVFNYCYAFFFIFVNVSSFPRQCFVFLAVVVELAKVWPKPTRFNKFIQLLKSQIYIFIILFLNKKTR